MKDFNRAQRSGGMIRVEVRKIPKRIVTVDEYEGIEDFELFVYKIFDFTLNR